MLASQNSMQRKMIRWATRLLTKKKGKGKLREREREKDPNRFAKKKKVQILACVHMQKTKELQDYIRLAAKLILTIPMLIS